MRKFIFLIFMTVFSIFTTGCDKEDIIKEVAIFLCYLGEYGQQGILISDPIADPNQSEVIIKWDSHSHVFTDEHDFWERIYFSDTLDLDVLKNYTIELMSNVGYCWGTVTFPGATSITEPELYDTLQLGVDITVTWNIAQGADFYFASYWLEAYDSNGSYIGEWDGVERYITSTHITIPDSALNAIDASYYRVNFSVLPFSGVMPLKGESSNMSGSANGFLTAGPGDDDGTIFWVGEPVKNHKENEHMMKQPTRRELLNKYLEAFGIKQNYDEKFILP